MVDVDVVSRKIVSAQGYLQAIAEALARPREEFLAVRKDRDVTAFYAQLAIQECIDLAGHYIADAGWPAPIDAGSSFDELADRGVIDRQLAATMRAAVGLRNLIAHGYAAVDSGRLYDDLRQGALDLKRFLEAIAEASGLYPSPRP